GCRRGAPRDDPSGAAGARRVVVELEPNLEVPPVAASTVRKLLARHRLALGQPAQARAALGPLDDPEVRWLRARADLQEGQPCEDQPNPTHDPLAPEPATYLGASRCAACHAAIARRHRASHHARTFWSGAALARLPLPDRPLPDPANPAIVHALRREGNAARVEARVEGRAYRALLTYA